MRAHKIILEALTPIAHQDTIAGDNSVTNERIFMRQGQIVNGRPIRAPAISENMLRNVLWRTPLADDLLTRLDIARGSLPQGVLNLLYSGGAMAAGSRAPGDEITLGHSIKKTYPSLDLLGGAVNGFILPRSRLRLAAWIVARENASAIRAISPDLAAEADKNSVFDLIAPETRTRGTGGDSAGNQMIYGYETLCAGAKILIEATLDPHTPDVTRAALGYALSIWDGYIGGQARQGRGRMSIIASDAASGDLYNDYVDAHKDALSTGLIDGSLCTHRQRLCA